jgi:hypothetical protein
MRWRSGRTWSGGSGKRAPLDIVGFLLLAPNLLGLLYGLSNASGSDSLTHADVLAPVISGLVLLALFVVWALRRGTGALLDLRLLKYPQDSDSSKATSPAQAATVRRIGSAEAQRFSSRDPTRPHSTLRCPKRIPSVLSRSAAEISAAC